jgi:hypothetical protein
VIGFGASWLGNPDLGKAARMSADDPSAFGYGNGPVPSAVFVP